MTETASVSVAQTVLLNYHPSLACGLTSFLTGLTLFYVVYTNIPRDNKTKDVDFHGRRFVTKFEGGFSGFSGGSEDMAAKIKAWEAINDVTDYLTNNPKEKYIFVGRTHTRLGNIIFEFISGLAIGRTLNRTVLFSRQFSELFQVFPNTRPYMRMAPMSIDSGFAPLPEIVEGGAAYYEDWLYKAIPKDVNVKICCYFQSYKYFQDMEKEVRKMLQPSQKYLAKVSEFMQGIKNENKDPELKLLSATKTLVGVHVRKGDMATRDHWKAGRLTAPKEYILHAMNYYRTHLRNVHFIVCSDDIQWCIDNIPESKDVTFSMSNDKFYDFVLLSQCDHSIMTVGTYGWWASWLTNGTVVYYDYQNKPGSYFGRRMCNEDFFPPSWIPETKLPEQ